eukprot:TRINITY_DN2740_c0_g1_i2.p1 TRINITY_DN2740_c0_g1~~TRINITY_DN2740_c0_g1_i2.p1  ORF type:complete len:273 (-),score=37.85 TRINITY_DN2740_c0_g1_i2:10-828(-)
MLIQIQSLPSKKILMFRSSSRSTRGFSKRLTISISSNKKVCSSLTFAAIFAESLQLVHTAQHGLVMDDMIITDGVQYSTKLLVLQSAECSNRFSLEQASVQQKHSCRHRVDYHPTPSPHVVDELSQYPLHEDDGFRHTHPAQTNSRRVPSPSLLEAARRFEAYTSVFRHSGGYMDHKITDGHMMRPRHSPPVVVPPQQKIVLPDTQILVPYVRNLAALDTHLSESDRFVQMMKAVHQQFPVLRDPLYFSALRILLKDAVAGRLLFGNLDQAN